MQFWEAFSCFVFSEQEPKGINYVEKFKAIQDWFWAYPDVPAERMVPVFARDGTASLFTIASDGDDKPNLALEPLETPRDCLPMRRSVQ